MYIQICIYVERFWWRIGKKLYLFNISFFFHIREVMVLYVQWQRITREYYCSVTGSYEHSLTIIWSRKYVQYERNMCVTISYFVYSPCFFFNWLFLGRFLPFFCEKCRQMSPIVSVFGHVNVHDFGLSGYSLRGVWKHHFINKSVKGIWQFPVKISSNIR